MKRFAALLGLLALVSSAPAEELPAKPVTVPFVLLKTGHFLVTVKLNEKGPYNLIFDTGAPTMLINNRIAKDSGVSKGSGGFLLGANQITIPSLEVGTVKAEKIPAIVMDHPTVEAFSKAFKKEFGSIDGIVGYPFFGRFRMTVDYQAREMTFIPNGYKPVDVTQSMMNALMGASENKGKPKILASAGVWGIVVDKADTDEDAGVVVKSVMKESAAVQAGILVGDRLLTIDGRWTDSIGDTLLAAGTVQPGKKAVIVVLREGKEVSLSLTPKKGF